MEKELIRVSVDTELFSWLDSKAKEMGVSVPTYSRIVLKESYNKDFETNKKEEHLFPFEFQGKIYHKKQCSIEFLERYTDSGIIDSEGIYITNGVYMRPNGEVVDFE
jgi:hypothetical protein